MTQSSPVIDPAGRPDAILGALAQLCETPVRRGHTYHRDRERTSPRQRIERGKDHLVCEIARDAE
jgi:hypothetical protein